MTTGAVTRMVDWLERAGYVRREPDPADRRRVVVQVVPARIADIGRYYEPIGERWHQQVSEYSDAQLKFLLDFLRQGREHAQVETTTLRTEGRPHATRRRAVD